MQRRRQLRTSEFLNELGLRELGVAFQVALTISLTSRMMSTAYVCTTVPYVMQTARAARHVTGDSTLWPNQKQVHIGGIRKRDRIQRRKLRQGRQLPQGVRLQGMLQVDGKNYPTEALEER